MVFVPFFIAFGTVVPDDFDGDTVPGTFVDGYVGFPGTTAGSAVAPGVDDCAGILCADAGWLVFPGTIVDG